MEFTEYWRRKSSRDVQKALQSLQQSTTECICGRQPLKGVRNKGWPWSPALLVGTGIKDMMKLVLMVPRQAVVEGL